MDDEFKIGDKVRYINTTFANVLTNGKIYDVLNIRYDSDKKIEIQIMCDNGDLVYLYPLDHTNNINNNWFEKVEDIIEEINFLDLLKGY
jgi:hypothetical protein